MAERAGVQHGAAADGFHRGVEPDDEPVAGFGGDGLRQPQLGIAVLSGGQFVPVQQHRLCQLHGGAVIQMHLGAAENGAAGIR